MPGPPPPPPPPMMGGPPPPPSLGGLSAAAPDRNALLKSIADPSKPKLKKVDPSQIKDRSKPTVGGGVVGSSSDPVSTKKTSGVASSGPNPMAGMSLQDQLAKRLQERNRTNNSPAPSVQSNNLIATHQQTKHNTNTNNSSNHYASNSVINKPLPTVPSSNVNSRQSNKENGPSNSVNNLQNHKKVLENFFSSSSNSSSVSTPSSVSSANGQAVNSKSNDTNKSKANGEMKKMAPPVPPPRQDLSRDDTMLNKYHGQNQIPAFSKPVRAPSPSSTGATPQFPTTNKPPPPPPAPMSQQQQHPPLPPTPAQAPPLPPYNRNMTKPLNVAPPPPPPPVAPPPIPDKYSHHPPPPPPPNQPPPPPPPSRPAPPRPPPQPPTKSIDDLERRFQFLPLPGSADLPRVFSPPNDREYPSAKYEVKMRSNGNH